MSRKVAISSLSPRIQRVHRFHQLAANDIYPIDIRILRKVVATLLFRLHRLAPDEHRLVIGFMKHLKAMELDAFSQSSKKKVEAALCQILDHSITVDGRDDKAVSIFDLIAFEKPTKYKHQPGVLRAQRQLLAEYCEKRYFSARLPKHDGARKRHFREHLQKDCADIASLMETFSCRCTMNYEWDLDKIVENSSTLASLLNAILAQFHQTTSLNVRKLLKVHRSNRSTSAV